MSDNAEDIATPRADAIVGAYLDKCDTEYPDGSSAEDIERDLRNPIRQLERDLADAVDDCLRLHKDKMDFFEEKIRLERELSVARSESGESCWKRRFEWLADKVVAPDYGDNDSSPHRKGYYIEHCKGADTIYGDSFAAAVDEMIELEASDARR